MSKKRFSQGLEDLFHQSNTDQMEVFGGARMAAVVPQERKSSHKNFMTDLDALLQEALDEGIQKFDANQPDTVTQSSKSKATAQQGTPRIASGLDALIRQTIDIQEYISDENSGKKRLTVAVDRVKLDKLKTIAKIENAYLKDLLVALIDDYIETYNNQKGIGAL